MQAVMNNQSALASFRFAGGRSYMMRSEKRGGSGPAHRSPTPGGRPPRRRRRAGFFYKLFMMILLLTIWPIGLLMLWRRKVRWGVFTKLLTSVVTLAACIILLGFALTVNTGNAQYTAIQDSVNGFLDVAADTLIDTGDIVADRAAFVYEGMTEFSDALWEGGKVHLSNAIDAGVALTQRAKVEVLDLIDKLSQTPAPTDAGEATPHPEETDAETTPEATIAPTTTPTPQPTPEPTPEIQVFTVKSAADATVYYNDGGKCYHMTRSCGSMTTAMEHTFGETLDVSNHRCSVCGTPEKTMLDEEYIVWLDEENIAHLTDECTAFNGGWKLATAAEANENGNLACPDCEAYAYLNALAEGEEIIIEPAVTPEPTAEPTEEPTQAPTEEPTAEPTEAPSQEPTEAPSAEPIAETESETATAAEIPTQESAESTEEPTEAPTEEPTEAPTEEPTAEPTEAPTEEPTEEPTEAPTEEPTAEPTEAPTEEPTAEPTPEITAEPVVTAEPEPQVLVPSTALKPAGQATVYHSSNGKWYHTFNRCSDMTGGGAFTLEECASTHKQCNACGAPSADLIGQPCLWKDVNDLCHTSDECTSFTGKYALILRDDALSRKLSGCTACHADEYLVANSTIDYASIQPAESAAE